MDSDAWMEFRADFPFELSLNGRILPVMRKEGRLVRYRIPDSGRLRIHPLKK